jgi:malate dehydrogenase (oxaloacetate-decarboxylating)
MLELTFHRDPDTLEEWISTPLKGKALLNTPLLNKSTAFTQEERRAFDILGKLPVRVETLEEQAERAYEQYRRYTIDLSRHIYLYNLHERNEVLFYKLVSDHLEEMMPIIYTPIVGNAVKQFSREFRSPRGLYLSIPDRDDMASILENRTHPEIDLIVVSDGSGVLGIGDQGVGAMDIPIAKLMVYTLCGGLNPVNTLPIMLDVGTDNQILLNDPFYLGWKHERVKGPEYDSFIHQFFELVSQRFPNSFLHWEDFGRDQAHGILERYKNEFCTFNDDIQGTGAVCLAAILAGLKVSKTTLADQRFIIFGAGAAGVGIADQICATLVRQGMPLKEAQSKFWLLNSRGLIMEGHEVKSFQAPYARTLAETADWKRNASGDILLEEVVAHAKPTVLVGTSAVAGAFHENLVRTMARHCERPIIMPLSNPTEKAEAHPSDLLEWTEGRALIATGSPFNNISFKGTIQKIAQCNNALVFPGLGMGILASRSNRLSESMLWAACEALSELSPALQQGQGPLLPSISEARKASYQIALRVAQQAFDEGLNRVPQGKPVRELLDEMLWYPKYLPFKAS